jgi:hypothetical protein
MATITYLHCMASCYILCRSLDRLTGTVKWEKYGTCSMFRIVTVQLIFVQVYCITILVSKYAYRYTSDVEFTSTIPTTLIVIIWCSLIIIWGYQVDNTGYSAVFFSHFIFLLCYINWSSLNFPCMTSTNLFFQPFEAVFKFVKDIDNFLEKLITWPRDLGNAIMNCQQSFPSPM